MTAKMQQPTTCVLPEQRPGETLAAYYKRVAAWLRGEDVRSKADNREWTGSPPFHLNRE